MMVEAAATAPPRMLFELWEALQDCWADPTPLEAPGVVGLEMQFEAVDDEIERRGLRTEHKIFLRTQPRRLHPYVREARDD